MDNVITLTDENGVQKQFQFIFAVNHEITKETFQFFMELDTDSPEVVAYKVSEDGYLVDIESKEEWQFAADMFNAYMSQMHGGCSGCHGGSCDCDGGCDCDGDCGCEN